MSNFPISPSATAAADRHVDSSFLQTSSPPSSRALPGASLLSPQAKPKATPTALLSPPGSRYAFDSQEAAVMSPLLTTTTIKAGIGSTRPLSAQDLNVPGGEELLNFASRPFSTTGGSGYVGFGIPERPLSSMEVDSATLKSDLEKLNRWAISLNSNQQRTLIDDLLSTLPDEILQYTKSKLDNINFSNSNNFAGSKFQDVVCPVPTYNQEPLTLDAVLNSTAISQQQPPQPWSPTTNSFQRALSPNISNFDRSSTFQESLGINRPRSADPYNPKFFNKENIKSLSINDPDLSELTPSKSRLFNDRLDAKSAENLLNQYQQDQFLALQQQQTQQLPYDGRTMMLTNLSQQLNQAPVNFNDYSNVNALKLSALSTINSRVQLDSNRKRAHQQHNQSDERGRNLSPFNNFSTANGLNYDEGRNSLSVPPPQRVNYYESISLSPSISTVMGKQPSNHRGHGNSKQGHKHTNSDGQAALDSIKNLSLNESSHHNYTPLKGQLNSLPKSPAINSKQITNIKLLNDIPAWLKALRLHKYTSALQDIPWKELIYYSDKQLEERGVTAMGARGKLLKAFDVVRIHYENGEIKE